MTSQTCSYTVGASATKMLVGVDSSAGDVVTTVAWNGSSAGVTLIDKCADAASASENYFYFLDSPTSGTHNLVVSASGSTNLDTLIVSYNGMASGAPSVFGHNCAPASAPVSVSLTPGSDNNWIVGYFADHNQAAFNIAKNNTLNVYSLGTSFQGAGDTGDITPAAAKTLGMDTNPTGGSNPTVLAAAFPPAASACPPSSLPLLHVANCKGDEDQR